jgi:hypothetical protein
MFETPNDISEITFTEVSKSFHFETTDELNNNHDIFNFNVIETFFDKSFDTFKTPQYSFDGIKQKIRKNETTVEKLTNYDCY